MYNGKLLDGTSQHISIYTNKCYGEDVPFGERDVTNIEITHNKHDVNLIKSNFLNITARVDVALNNDNKRVINYKAGTMLNDIISDERAATESKTEGTYYDLYIGRKHSSECMTQMQVFNKGKDTGYMQIFQDRDN